MRSFVIRMAMALGLLGACGREAPAEGTPAHAASDDSLCGASFPDYKPGMSVQAGALTVKLRSAQPPPPRQKIPNHWELEFLNERGAPITDATLSNPDSFMPAHNHHGRTRPSIAPPREGGSARIEDIDFNMRGPWQVLVDVNQAGTKVGTATFQVCVR